MEANCPKCDHTIENQGIQKQFYHCDACGVDLKLKAACDKCGDKLELLQACGAANLWCNNCNELKSKSEAVYTFQEA